MSRWQEICADYERAAADLQRAQDEIAILNRYAIELDWPLLLSSPAMLQALDDLLEAHRDMATHIDADLS